MNHSRAPGAGQKAVRQVTYGDKVMMMAATLARMGLGLVTFVLLARYLDPESFGLIATAMSYNAFVGIVTDFGLGTAALREAAAAPERAVEVMSDALAVKGMLTCIIALAGGLALTLLMPADRLAVYALVFAGALAYSFAELSLIAARARSRFDLEAKIVVATSAFMLLAVGGAAALSRSAVVAASAFAITRLGYLSLVAFSLRHWLGNPFNRPPSHLIATCRRASSYAADSFLTSLATQVDVLLFGVFLSLHDMGIYQSGARLVQVILPFAVVLSTVYLPSLVFAQSQGKEADFRREAGRLTWEFTILAVFGGFAFAFVAPIVTDILYGKAYIQLKSLWTGFAIFAVLRFTSAAYGVQLVARGRIWPRVLAQITAIALFAIASLVFLPRFGLSATTWLLAASALPPFLLLGLSLVRSSAGGRQVGGSMAFALLVTASLAATKAWK